MITVRQPEEIHQITGDIPNGTFRCRCHFSFEQYYDAEHECFGTMRAFNDHTLSPGAARSLHPHRDIEVVTYCVKGELRHADEYGPGSLLKSGGVQHITVGRGMWYAETNNLPDMATRYVQMWFTPVARDLIPSVEQVQVDRKDRLNRLLPIVSARVPGALPIFADAEVHACFLEERQFVSYQQKPKRGVYVYVLDGGPALLNRLTLPALSAAMAVNERSLALTAAADAEILLVDVLLT